jgi:3-oxoacyl-[acyl-carrier protein] reductase
VDLGLKGRVAVVAAASQGLGKAVAMSLSREGAIVAICARNRATLYAAQAEISRATDGGVMASVVDVTDGAAVRTFVAEVAESYGRIDICVANAGGPPTKSFEETTEEDWRAAAEMNLMSTVHLAHATLPLMKQRRWGRFIAITSVTVKQPVEGLILSNAVRAGVSGLVKTLANEYGRYNVLVNNVCPGYTATARLLSLAQSMAKREGIDAKEVEERWASQSPMGRVGLPEEFADVVAFLASERAGFVTGVSLAVDGGLVKGLY